MTTEPHDALVAAIGARLDLGQELRAADRLPRLGQRSYGYESWLLAAREELAATVAYVNALAARIRAEKGYPE
jgi:hypothetical protein